MATPLAQCCTLLAPDCVRCLVRRRTTKSAVFLTFPFTKHLARGYGLVFNTAGEYSKDQSLRTNHRTQSGASSAEHFYGSPAQAGVNPSKRMRCRPMPSIFEGFTSLATACHPPPADFGTGNEKQFEKMKKYTTTFIMLLWAIFLSAQAPTWPINPADYANSMTFTAQVHLDGNEVNSGNNVLAAFAGKDVRGVAAPTNIGGQHYYFLTVHSNAVADEGLLFKVYLENEDDTYTALEQIDFTKNANMGDYPNGYGIHLSLDGDFPVGLLAMPDDTTLASCPFDKIPLADFLLSQDNDPVNWSITNGANITGTLSGDTLDTVPNDPMWTGTDSLLVTVTETGTPNNYTASHYVRFTVDANYAAPVFASIPDQLILIGQPAPSGDLNNYLTYTGPCLEYAYQLTPLTGSDPVPSWSQPSSGGGPMTLVAQANFGGQAVLGTSNLLAGFVNGQLVGVAQQQLLAGKEIFFLTLANIESGDITLKFYDAANQYQHEQESSLPFVPNGTAGTFTAPFQMDFAPFSIGLLATGEWDATVLGFSWSGSQEVLFSAVDCSYPDKADAVSVNFIADVCSIGNISWSGAGDGFLWSDPNNWSDGFVPQGCHHVLIPNGETVIVEGGYTAFGKTLEVELGAALVTDLSAVLDIGN